MENKYVVCKYCKNREKSYICDECKREYEYADYFAEDSKARSEEKIRQDEKEKFITLLKSDYENYEGLADDFNITAEDYKKYDDRTIDYYINEKSKCIAVANYIDSTIKLLESEKKYD